MDKRRYQKQKKTHYGRIWFLAFLILCAILLSSLPKFDLTPDHYQLILLHENGSEKEVGQFTSFGEAKKKFDTYVLQGNKDNLAIREGSDKFLAIRYGVVDFKKENCEINVSYTIASSKKEGYTNGCYAADGAYIDTSDDGKKIKFKQGGAVGWVKTQDVTLRNYYDKRQVASINHYRIDGKSLIHKGTVDLTKEAYYIALDIGDAVKFMDNDTMYFSYDAHYFYNTFEKMIDDYRSNTNQNSVNATFPYINFYQYVSHRSRSFYEASDINNYITKTLGYTQKPENYPMQESDSLLYQSGSAFINSQNEYGANAIMMLSLAINESSYGRSSIAFNKNNVFGHAAYDKAPEKSANKYKSIANSIATHANIFLNQGYLNPCDGDDDANACDNANANRYRGSYFGDKESGMNVRYASDPYWGEKAAALYRKFDRVMGKKDEKGIFMKVTTVKAFPVYKEPDKKSTVLYKTPTSSYYSFLILEQIYSNGEKWYKVQSDAPLNKNRSSVVLNSSSYNLANDYAYIPVSYID